MDFRTNSFSQLRIPRFLLRYCITNRVKRNPLPTPEELIKNRKARQQPQLNENESVKNTIQPPRIIVSLDIRAVLQNTPFCQSVFNYCVPTETKSKPSIRPASATPSTFSSHSPQLSIKYSGSENETEDETVHEPEVANPVNTPRVYHYSSDSNTSNDGGKFFSRFKQRIEIQQAGNESNSTATNLIPELPETDCEFSVLSPPYEAPNFFSSAEFYSFLSEEELQTQPKKNNKEPQRQRKRLI